MKKLIGLIIIVLQLQSFAQNKLILDSISNRFANYLIGLNGNKTEPYDNFMHAIKTQLNTSDTVYLNWIGRLEFAETVSFDSISNLVIGYVYDSFLDKHYAAYMADVDSFSLAYVNLLVSKGGKCLEKYGIDNTDQLTNVEDLLSLCMKKAAKDSSVIAYLEQIRKEGNLKKLLYASQKGFIAILKYSNSYRNYFFQNFQYQAQEQTDNVRNEFIGFGNYFKQLEKLNRAKDFEKLKSLFPDYQKYTSLLNELSVFKPSFYRNENLYRKKDGTWIYSRKLIRENYATKKGESLELAMSFDKLELKPTIKQLQKIKKMTYRISEMDIPPPPPPDPMLPGKG